MGGARYAAVASEELESDSSADAPDGQPAVVAGYTATRKASCAARTMDQGKLAADECRSLCEVTRGCQCFETTGTRCRIAQRAGRRLKKASLRSNVAYVRDEGYTNPDIECLEGDKRSVNGSCREYQTCKGGRFASERCAHDLAYNPARGRCDWPGLVPSCAGEGALPAVKCGRGNFLLASESSPGMQEWIKLEIDDWFERIRSEPEIQSRPEGSAATMILRTADMNLGTRADGNSTTSRWAVFSEGRDGSRSMQAVALVQTIFDEIGPTVDIMAIVSRRALFNDDQVKSGAGKALISSILRTVHDMVPDMPLTLIGVPGDKFVEKAYIAHGMKEYGRDERGYPKLRVVYPVGCVDWMTSAMMCKEMTWTDYASIAWRLFPGSGYLKEICAHIIPPSLFITEIGKMGGLR